MINDDEPRDSSLPSVHRNDVVIKILMIGNIGVGKSQIMLRFTTGKFHSTFAQTIGVDFKLKPMKVEGKKIQVQVWDTSGQERFKSMTGNYYRGANAVICVFDLTNKSSFEAVPTWIDEVLKNSTPDVVVALVGNKYDLETQRAVTYEEAQKVAGFYGIKYYETSAKDNKYIEELFFSTALQVYYHFYPNEQLRRKNTIEIESAEKKKKDSNSSNSCC